jgi:hypothetical protein
VRVRESERENERESKRDREKEREIVKDREKETETVAPKTSETISQTRAHTIHADACTHFACTTVQYSEKSV